MQVTDDLGEPRKACPRCRSVKGISEFHRKYADDPLSSQTYCRKCHGDMKREKGGVRAPPPPPSPHTHILRTLPLKPGLLIDVGPVLEPLNFYPGCLFDTEREKCRARAAFRLLPLGVWLCKDLGF